MDEDRSPGSRFHFFRFAGLRITILTMPAKIRDAGETQLHEEEA
jgi:hypothetical protein